MSKRRVWDAQKAIAMCQMLASRNIQSMQKILTSFKNNMYKEQSVGFCDGSEPEVTQQTKSIQNDLHSSRFIR
jgi:hypothetical protein